MKHWLAMAAVMATATTAGSGEHAWRTYANVRFAYQVCYPADLLKAQPESDNGDGRMFTGANGTKLTVWGNNAMGSVAEAAATGAERLGTVSYKVVKPDWFVLSAKQGGTVVYLKSRRSGDKFESFELRYPAAAAVVWAPVVARMGACLRGLDGPTYGRPSG